MDAEALVRAFAGGPPIRAVNFHNTPVHRAEEYDRQLGALAERFGPVTEDDLAAFLATGRWTRSRPGVVIALYNGYRNNFDVMRPLLERHGLVGWFFVASGYVGCPVAEQLAFGAAHTLATIPDEYPDGRYALSWDEVRELDRAGARDREPHADAYAGLGGGCRGAGGGDRGLAAGLPARARPSGAGLRVAHGLSLRGESGGRRAGGPGGVRGPVLELPGAAAAGAEAGGLTRAQTLY